MRTGVITFPGSNCDDDAVSALRSVGELEVERLWHKDLPELCSFDLVVLPGGFSYGDYLRCGAIAALSPIMEKVKSYAGAGGLVIGICNGFQTLCEAGLLPGALARNERLGFICRDVRLKVMNPQTPWTLEARPEEEWRLPIAHGDGRYVISAEEHEAMGRNGQIILTYVENPNGSARNLAGVCNREKNVLGLMPHPERATDLRSRDGAKLWKSVARFLRERTK